VNSSRTVHFDDKEAMAQDLPIACSLSAPDLEERLAEMAVLGDEALIDRRIDGTHAQLRFATGVGVRDRVAAIAAAESSCCAFLTLRVTGGLDVVVLDVDASEGAGPALAEWVEAFDADPALASREEPGGDQRFAHRSSRHLNAH